MSFNPQVLGSSPSGGTDQSVSAGGTAPKAVPYGLMGDTGETPDFEPRQIIVGRRGVWDELNRWARSRRLRLTQIYSNEDDLPTYCFAYEW